MEDIKNEVVSVEESEKTLDSSTNNLVNKIVESDSVDKTKDLLALFNVNMAKKSAARVAKLNDLLDKVNDEAIERFEKRPDAITNKELLDYMNVVQNQIEKSTNTIQSISEVPAVNMNQQNEVNININNDVTSMSKESRDRILSAVESILKNVSNQENVIDATVTKKETQGGKHE